MASVLPLYIDGLEGGSLSTSSGSAASTVGCVIDGDVPGG